MSAARSVKLLKPSVLHAYQYVLLQDRLQEVKLKSAFLCRYNIYDIFPN